MRIPIFLAVSLLASACAHPTIQSTTVFAEGSDSCHFYRIPAMTLDAKGNIVAVIDRRYENLADLGYRSTSIDISCKRSTDVLPRDYPDTMPVPWPIEPHLFYSKDGGERWHAG